MSEELFEVERSTPPDRIAVGRKESIRPLITEFKKKHKIWTYYAKGVEDPWCALKLDEKDSREPMTAIAEECVRLEESGQYVTGKGELSVIRELCKNLNIPCNL